MLKKNTNQVVTAERRMRNDIQNYNQNKIDNVVLSFPNVDSVTELHITIYPNQQNSYYRNSRITFSYTATEKYPFEQPEVKCLNKILHPNIDKNGNVCLNLLRTGWKPIYELHLIIIGLLHLLQNIKAADLEEPLDRDAAALMSKDSEQFDRVVQETIKGKPYFNRMFDNVYYVPKKK